MNRLFLAPLLFCALSAPPLCARADDAPPTLLASGDQASKYLRAALAPLPEPQGEGTQEVPPPLLLAITQSQPQAGQALLEIIADKKSPLHRRAVNAFVASWKSMSGEQIVQYFLLQLEPQPRLRPHYPNGFDAAGQLLYRFNYGWGGLASGFPFRVRVSHFVDGELHGEARSYTAQGPDAATGWIKTGDLALGKHTTSMSLEFEFEHAGATHRGQLRSPDFGFEVVDAEAPDDLEVVKGDQARALVEKALVLTGTYGATLGGYSAAQGRYGLQVPSWALNDSLPFALCFDVEFQADGKVFKGGPFFLPAGRGYTGAFNLEAINEFIAGRQGRVPVKVVLRPSYRMALSDSQVKSFYGGTLEFDNLHVDVLRPPGWAAPLGQAAHP